jgi:sulfate/thiosulfate transport system ATP-binding protein
MSVVIENLTKRFGASSEAAAVAGVSFEAPSGKITSLLGPSGSGKSTVLRVIAGLEEPDQGTVRIDGADTTNVPVRERGVGFVFQGYALFGNMTVYDNIAFGLSIRKTAKSVIAERVTELLALIQLQGYEGRFPRQLSGGQRQRVALARSLATRPKVLLLDEPFGALDAQVREELREWLVQFHDKTGVTTLLVTHDQQEALELSEHVVLLRDGKVIQAGSPHELYDRPASAFVASFLGGSNVIHGKVENGRVSTGALEVALPDGSQDGANVSAFIRPHDVRLEKAPEITTDVAVARIERLTRVGGHVKLSLRLANGDAMNVQLTRGEVEALDVEQGDRVFVDLKEAKVFVEDYAI